MSGTYQQTVRCPNCGNQALRRYFIEKEVTYHAYSRQPMIRTECDHCDYLMMICASNGAVIESQFPGIRHWKPVTHCLENYDDIGLSHCASNTLRPLRALLLS